MNREKLVRMIQLRPDVMKSYPVVLEVDPIRDDVYAVLAKITEVYFENGVINVPKYLLKIQSQKGNVVNISVSNDGLICELVKHSAMIDKTMKIPTNSHDHL